MQTKSSPQSLLFYDIKRERIKQRMKKCCWIIINIVRDSYSLQQVPSLIVTPLKLSISDWTSLPLWKQGNSMLFPVFRYLSDKANLQFNNLQTHSGKLDVFGTEFRTPLPQLILNTLNGCQKPNPEWDQKDLNNYLRITVSSRILETLKNPEKHQHTAFPLVFAGIQLRPKR